MNDALILALIALAVVPLVGWGVVSSGVHWTRQSRRRQSDAFLRLFIQADLSVFVNAIGKIEEAAKRSDEAMRRLATQAAGSAEEDWTRRGPGNDPISDLKGTGE